MNSAQLLVRCLEQEGVRFVFGLPGEENLDLIDALADSSIRFIETRHGVIRWKQQLKFGRSSFVDFGNPDFVRYAESFGAVGYRVTASSELAPILAEALKQPGPSIIDCPVDYDENIRLSERLRAMPEAFPYHHLTVNEED